MALIQCPECNKNVSDRANTCIHCGFPIKEYFEEQRQKKAAEEINQAMKKQIGFYQEILISSKWKNKNGYSFSIKEGKTYRYNSDGKEIIGVAKILDGHFICVQENKEDLGWGIDRVEPFDPDKIEIDSEEVFDDEEFMAQSGEFFRVE